MIRQFFSEEQLSKFNCINCINYSICDRCNQSMKICNEFSPTEDILYDKIYELHKINRGCAELYCTLRT